MWVKHHDRDSKDVRRQPVRPGRGGRAWKTASWRSWTVRRPSCRDDPEYLHLLSIPSIPKKERCALLDEALRRAGPPLCAELSEDPVREGHPAGAAGLRTGLPRPLQRRPTASWRPRRLTAVPLIEEQTDRPARQKLEAVTGKTIASGRKGGHRLCWAASGWTSRAPSWTARCRIGWPPCGGTSRQQLL